MKFETRLKLRIMYEALAVAGGLVWLCIGFVLKKHTGGFSSGYVFGLGAGLTATSSALLVKNVSVLRNKEKCRAKRIEEQDERNTMLNITSSHIAFLATIYLLFAGTLYYAFHDEKVLNVLTYVIIFMVAVKLLAGIILRRRI